MPKDDSVQPYVGPRPFGREDAPLFFGRDREANEVLARLLAHPAVLLYAPSGAGKTSLLQARLVPLLEEREAQVLGLARVRGEVPRDAAIANVYAFNTLMSLQGGDVSPSETLTETLTGHLRGQPYPEVTEGLSPLRVLIFDQFEEIFTSYPDRWKDRRSFFEQIGAALDEDPRLRVLFAMREEYLASVDPYATILPEGLETRFRLEPLRRKAALLAVTGPLGGTGRRFTDKAAEKLVDNLLQIPEKAADGMAVASAEFVEPVQLQVVCRRLWQSLSDEVTEIGEELIRDFGDVDQALAEYYEDCLRQVVEQTGAQEWGLRNWFEENLITPDGTRGLVFRDRKTTRGLPNAWIDRFEEMHLIRVEMRGGSPWYELAHDRFIRPIRASNRKQRQRRKLSDEEVRNLLQDRAFRRAGARKFSSHFQQPGPLFFRYLEATASTPEEAVEDWRSAELVFALEVLEGKIHLTGSLAPDFYPRLEREWLSEVKRTKAYLQWEERANPASQLSPERYYYDACKSLRGRLVDPQAKAPAGDFKEVEEYLRTWYLGTDGRFDPERPMAHGLVQSKAFRIWFAGHGKDSDTDWQEAGDYARMYYDNILPAVRDSDEESTLLVLKAFQFSRARENRYLIINCLEAAIAIYFLNPVVVAQLWKAAEGQEVPAAYTRSTVEADLPSAWVPPPALEQRLSFDGASRQLVLRGALRESEREALLATLPARFAGAVEELFQRSRLVPEDTTL